MAEIKFEKALERLQEIVETLEGGNIDIEKSLEYLRGRYQSDKAMFLETEEDRE